jgi:hypothetical protein
MNIWTVVEIDYPYGISTVYNVHTWTFDTQQTAEQFAKEKQNKYTAEEIFNGTRYNNVNVFRTILNKK